MMLSDNDVRILILESAAAETLSLQLEQKGWSVSRLGDVSVLAEALESPSIVVLNEDWSLAQSLHKHSGALLIILLCENITETLLLNAHQYDRVEVVPKESAALADVIDQLSSRTWRLRRRSIEAVHQRALQKMGQLSRGLSHQIRNPLNAAKLQLELLSRRAAGGSETREALKARTTLISNEIDRLASILDDFLTVARPVELSRSSFSLSALIFELLEAQSELLTSSTAKVDIDIAPDCDRVRWDRERISLALAALIENAAEAVARSGGGRITLAARPLKDGVRLSIKDEGPGFDSSVLQRALEPFSTTKRGGRGLGLPLADRIVDLHHGTLQIRSCAQGATIILRI